MRFSEAHHEYDPYANGEVQIGQLPSWMHISGKVAWYVYQGPYAGMPKGWSEFHKKVGSTVKSKPSGPPGDVYICDPDDHKVEAQETLLTILWMPVKD